MNFLLFLYLLAIAPKLFWDRWTKKKRHPAFLHRIGWRLPPNHHREVIWIHAVSVGEVKAVQSLFCKLRRHKPHAFFLITTTTATGQEEAKRSLEGADFFTYLPLDFSWIARRWARLFRPSLFLLVETDFWPHLLSSLKREGTKIALVNGKLSATSARRLAYFPSFSRKLFSHFDLLCVQSEEHRLRFLPFLSNPASLFITGNLKEDMPPQKVSPLSLPAPCITLSSTHFPEEEWLLDALQHIDAILFLAPRHPERFEEVAKMLKKKQISFVRWSQLSQTKRGEERIVLVDAMGQLPTCYTSSRLAIVGGSFVDQVGGHNVLEPCLYGIPVLFGPFAFAQKKLIVRVLQAKAGLQVSLEELPHAVQNILSHPEQEQQFRAAAEELIKAQGKATARTLELLQMISQSSPRNHLQ